MSAQVPAIARGTLGRTARAIGYGAAALLVLGLTLFALALVLANSVSGSRWLLQTASGYLPEALNIGGIDGTLAVRVDGRAVRSCVTPLAAVEGKDVETIEALAPGEGALHPLQAAWIEHQVPQCGYCQSGQLMSAAALLDANPNPTDEEIDRAMDGNLCRCGMYGRIKAAIKTAAKHLAAETAETPTTETVEGDA